MHIVKTELWNKYMISYYRNYTENTEAVNYPFSNQEDKYYIFMMNSACVKKRYYV